MGLGIDGTSALFTVSVLVIGLASVIGSMGYMRLYRDDEGLSPRLPYYPLLLSFIASMALIPLVRNWLAFLFIWEIMTLTSYFLIVYDWKSEDSRRAGWKYFVTMHLFDTSPLMFAVALQYAFQGTFSFSPIEHHRNVIVALFLVGFAAKAGLFPLHFWLPEAHPAAPSPVSALLSGAMVELGLYGSIRVLEQVNWHVAWWVTAMVGFMVVTSMLAALLSYPLQGDVKRLFAWSTIDNVGWMYAFLLAGMMGAAGVGRGASYYVLAHGMAKGAAFLTAGAIIYSLGTRRLTDMRGLLKSSPLLSGLFIASIFAVEGVPPFNLFLNKMNVVELLFRTNVWLGVFAVVEWVLAFVILLRFIHSTVLSGEPEIKPRRVPSSLIASVVFLLVLSLVSQAICHVIWGAVP